jgi:hypothetical protein
VTRRVHRLSVEPADVPIQLVLGLEGGVLAAIGKRAKGRRLVPGGSFDQGKAKAA